MSKNQREIIVYQAIMLGCLILAGCFFLKALPESWTSPRENMTQREAVVVSKVSLEHVAPPRVFKAI